MTSVRCESRLDRGPGFESRMPFRSADPGQLGNVQESGL